MKKGGDTPFMSRCQYMYLKPLFTTVMNRKHLAETVSRKDADAEPPWMGSRRVSARCYRFMSPGIICGAAVGDKRLLFVIYFPGLMRFASVPFNAWSHDREGQSRVKKMASDAR